MKRILITGALGHLGSHLVRSFQNSPIPTQLILLDNLSTHRYGVFRSFNPGFVFHDIDVKSRSLQKYFNDVDLVFHLAATTDASGTATRPELIFENNLIATKNIVEVCSNLQIPLVFPSSTSVYGSQLSLVDESFLQLNPQSPYAESKVLEEELVRELGSLGKTLRLGTIHGVSPGMRFHTAVNKFCWQAAWKQKISVWRTAMDQVRPYLAIQDFSEVAIKINNEFFSIDANLVNVVSQNTTPRQILEIIARYVDIEYEYVDDAIMNQLSYEVSNKLAIRVGFEFRDLLEMNIKETFDFLAVKTRFQA